MYKYSNVLLLIFSLSLTACSLFEGLDSKEIKKSPSDQRQYEYMQLENGLKVMLISDDAASFAAASLDVFVGSGSDPENRAGLAHFLEHMLFLGTEKYPDAAEYQSFIKKNAGTHNAYTSFEHTNYFFDVKADALDEALDRFSQFFVAPTLDAVYVSREKNAVDSEYKARIKDDARRNFDVLKTQVNPQHNFRKFSVGSLETLADKDGQNIRDDLLLFYNTWYKASNMALVVQGPQDLAQLKELVVSRFSAIAKGTVPSSVIDVPLFVEGSLPRWVTIQPEKQLRELSLIFPVPDQASLYDSKPLSAVGHVLGHEGRGSLFSYLKAQNWAESLAAGAALNYQGGSTFSINIALTEEGLNHQQDVIIAVFSAIKRLQQEGIPKSIVDDVAKIGAVSFAYQEASKPIHYVMGLSNNLHYYPVNKILSADYLLTDYRRTLIEDVINSLNLDNVLISVVADGFTNPLLSPHYDTPYAVGSVPKSLVAAIRSVEVNDAIFLPEKNKLLPEDFSLIEERAEKSPPQKILDEKGMELWYKPLDKFLLPKAVAYYSFQNTRLNADVKSRLLTDFTVSLLNDSLNEWVYPAQMAGLSYGFYAHDRGLTLKLAGFNNKQPQLLALLLSQIKNAEFTPEQFQRLKAQWQRNLLNMEKKPPYQKALAQWQVQMNKNRYSAQERLAVLQDIQLSDVSQWLLTLWQDSAIKALSSGNMTAQQALDMLRMVKNDLNINVLESKPAIEIIKLDPKPFYSQVTSQHADSGYVHYWQAFDNKPETQAVWLMLGKVLESDYFDQLRTQQQLGYIVFAHYYPVLTVPGLAFVVQSPQASVPEIHSATLAFLNKARDKIKSMSAQEYAQYQQSLQQKLLELPKQLAQESDTYWYEMAIENGVFGRKQSLAKQIESLSLQQWQQSAERVFAEYPKRSLLLGTDPIEALRGLYPFEAFEESRASFDAYIYN